MTRSQETDCPQRPLSHRAALLGIKEIDLCLGERDVGLSRVPFPSTKATTIASTLIATTTPAAQRSGGGTSS